jgi:hypothetical protein
MITIIEAVAISAITILAWAFFKTLKQYWDEKKA